MPTDHSPFNCLPEGSAPDNDVLTAAKRLGHVPKILITDNTLEHWTRSASLVHTDPTGMRLLVSLDRWVSEGVDPPPSRYPRIDKGELIPAAEHKARFPALPGLRRPGRNLQPPRVDYGPDFWTKGIGPRTASSPGAWWSEREWNTLGVARVATTTRPAPVGLHGPGLAAPGHHD